MELDLSFLYQTNVPFPLRNQNVEPAENRSMKSLVDAESYRGLSLDQFRAIITECKLQPTELMLSRACYHGSLAIIIYLVLKYKFRPNQDMLGFACESNSLDVILYLIERHELQPTEDMLREACRSNECQVIDFLVTTCDLKLTQDMLDVAICSGDNIKTVRFLVSKGLKLEPVHLNWASMLGHKEICRYLRSLR